MRSYPRLLHPVPVELEQIDKPGTVYDEDGREPVQQAARRAAVRLPAQLKFDDSETLRPTTTGPTSGADGYALFRMKDLKTAGITLRIGDRLRLAGDVPLDVYIDRLQPIGHLPRWNSTLVRAYFSDRQPAKQRS